MTALREDLHISKSPRKEAVLEFPKGEDRAYALVYQGDRLFFIFSRKGRFFSVDRRGVVRVCGPTDSWQGFGATLANQGGLWVYTADLEDVAASPEVELQCLPGLELRTLAKADELIEADEPLESKISPLRLKVAFAVGAVLAATGIGGAMAYGKPALEQVALDFLSQLPNFSSFHF